VQRDEVAEQKQMRTGRRKQFIHVVKRGDGLSPARSKTALWHDVKPGAYCSTELETKKSFKATCSTQRLPSELTCGIP
jgi:deoxyxylulose-5-phosphate synthase